MGALLLLSSLPSRNNGEEEDKDNPPLIEISTESPSSQCENEKDDANTKRGKIQSGVIDIIIVITIAIA